MLAGRLVRAASDILSEYSRFKISELLDTAASLSSRRGQLNDQQYSNEARNIKRQADDIARTSKIEQYPDDLSRFLKSSGYSAALPERIARMLIAGFPDDKNMAI